MDLYRFNLAPRKGTSAEIVALWIHRYGTGPFLILRRYTLRGYHQYYCVKSLQDGRIHVRWGSPEYWGVLDVFMTAAYNAVEQHENR